MKINKLDNELYDLLESTLKNYIQSWYRVPSDIDLDNLKIERIRYVKDWGLKTDPEDGFIIEFNTEEELYKELLGISELGLEVKELKLLIKEHQSNNLAFAKSITTNQFWYEYPVVWGCLDEIFDDETDYINGGKYNGNDYGNFGMKYE